MPPVDPARLNAVGDLVLTNPNELRALADPQRLTLFDLVRREGPATSSSLAQRVDRDAAWVDENLAVLEELGLVEKDGEARWSAVVRGIYFEIPDDPEGQAAARALSGVMIAKYAELPAEWVRDREPQLEVDWARAAGLFNARVDLAPAELQAVQEGLERLLEPFTTRSPAEMPSAAAPVRILAFFMPE
jgi:DNA-binding transcriptional ArsR family regulator